MPRKSIRKRLNKLFSNKGNISIKENSKGEQTYSSVWNASRGEFCRYDNPRLEMDGESNAAEFTVKSRIPEGKPGPYIITVTIKDNVMYYNNLMITAHNESYKDKVYVIHPGKIRPPEQSIMKIIDGNGKEKNHKEIFRPEDGWYGSTINTIKQPITLYLKSYGETFDLVNDCHSIGAGGVPLSATKIISFKK